MANKWALWPSSWGEINRFFPFHERFQESSSLHDLAYSIGGSEEDREEADEDFLIWCAEVSGKNPFALIMAIIYFIMVYKFWHRYFNYNKNK